MNEFDRVMVWSQILDSLNCKFAILSDQPCMSWRSGMSVGQVGLYQDLCVYGLICRNVFKILNGIYLSSSKKNLNVIVN